MEDFNKFSESVTKMKDTLNVQCDYLRLDKDSTLRASVEFFKFFKDFFLTVLNAIPKEQKKRAGAGIRGRGGPGGGNAALMAELQ